jgi:drug/metabolite transporter (DMT)-like permease
VIAILGGLGAALCFGASTLASSRSARLIGSASVVAWMMLIGLAVTLPGVLVTGVPDGLGAGTAGWLALSGCGNVFGMLVVYAALRIERVGIVAPICSVEGAIAAVIAILLGETIGGSTGAALAVIPIGVVLASVKSSEHDERDDFRGVLLSIGAAGIFGAGIYAAGRVSTEVPLTWALLPPRAVGVLVIALPLLASCRIRLSRRALPLVLVSGLSEVAGFACLTLGARHGIAVAAVLSSQFAVVAAVGGYLLFHERLSRIQLVGVIVTIAGVTALTALRATQ